MGVIESIREALKEMNYKSEYSQEGNFFFLGFLVDTKRGKRELKVFIKITENWVYTFAIVSELEKIPKSKRLDLYRDLLMINLYGREQKYGILDIDKPYITAHAEEPVKNFSKEDFKVEFNGVLAAAIFYFNEVEPKYL